MYIKRFVTVAINSLLSLQMFLPDECRCRCPNVAEKEECERHASGKKWDPVFCRCFCPSSTFAICEENQVYDFRNECRYVLLNKLVHYCYIITLIHCVWKSLLNCLSLIMYYYNYKRGWDISCDFQILWVAQFLMDLSGEILLGAFPETNYGQKLAQGH